MCVAAPAYVTDGSDAARAHALDQCRWFGGMVGNHVADIVNRYGGEGAAVPQSLTDYIAGRQGYDYNEHGRVGNTHTEFVPDEIVERFCLIGPPAHTQRSSGSSRPSGSITSPFTSNTTHRMRPCRRSAST